MTHIQREDIEHFEELALAHRSRLRVLERQIAEFGLHVPAHIVLDHDRTAQDLANVQTELQRLLPGSSSKHSPYMGLSTFQERDAHLFFGREALVADLIARVECSAFLAVLGASGSGKSSIVRAGLIPELKSGALKGSEHWRYALMRPGDRPLDALATVLANMHGDDLASKLALSATLATDERTLLQVTDLLLDGQDDARLVLVIDQTEELWSLAPTDQAKRTEFIEQQQQPFIRLLLAAAETERAPNRPPILIILTMRADFLHRAAAERDLARFIGDHDVIVSPMTTQELRSAIMRPAEAASCRFEPGLVDELVEQVQGRPGELPLLEYTLLELWKGRTPDGTLTWQTFENMGRVEGALAGRAEAIVAQHYPAPGQQEQLRQSLLRLVQPGDGAADTRRRALLDDLVPVGGSVEDVQALLQPLADERLIIIGRDPATGMETVELAHEALIHAWPTFGKWISEARVDLGLLIQFEEAAKEWSATDKNADFLWNGLRLANAEAWIVRAQPPLNARDQAFLNASRAQAEARAAEESAVRQQALALEHQARRRLQWLVAVLSVVLMTGTGFLARPYAFRFIAQGELIRIPPGAVIVGTNDPAADPNERPELSVDLPAFAIEKFEVSNHQYQLCVDVGYCAEPVEQPKLIYAESFADHPVVGISAYQAAIYCRWLGRRLPSELEWERAARGPMTAAHPKGTLWPWGDEPLTVKRANMRVEGTTQGTEPVQSYPEGQSAEHVFNLIGNVWEWTASYASENYNDYHSQIFAYDRPDASLAVIRRGGGWTVPISRMTVRDSVTASSAKVWVGMRCAADQ